MHTSVEAPILGGFDEEGLVIEETNPIEPTIPNPAEEMVQKWSMALDC